MRVLHLGKFYLPHKGGMETYLHSLCQRMQGLVDLRVIVANDSSESAESVVDNIPVTRVGTLFKFSSAPICPGMVRKIRETDADLVHIHFPNPTAILAYLYSGHRGRLIISYHSDIVKQRVLGKGFEPILRWAMARSSAVIAASPNYVKSSAILSDYEDRCHVIPYGISLQDFGTADGAEIAAIRERFGPRIVLAVGRLVYYKGFDYLIEAMKSVRGRLLIVGDGPLRAALEQKAELEGVKDRVVFLGHVPNLTPYYHAADVFVLASSARSEAFGIVQLEAMACGKPVVNTALDSGVPFVSLHGVTGLTVPPADSMAMANAISLLLDDDDLRHRYGQAARQRVQQVFSLEEMTESTYRLYQRVMQGTGSAADVVKDRTNGFNSDHFNTVNGYRKGSE